MSEILSLKEKLKTLESDLLDQQTRADAGKINANGSFGKLGSKWSILYSPELLIQVTLTGQLALLMLIEAIELAGISVVSGNTDGIVIKVPRDDTQLPAIIAAWEQATGLHTEETQYSHLYSMNVNNYIAIKPDGNIKTKGIFSFDGLHKNPSNMICNDAVINKLIGNVDVEDTIRACDDVRRFVTIRQVKGGAVTNDGEYLGKAVRWYYSDQSQEYVAPTCIRYMANGNLVAASTGATPLMELPLRIPDDLNYTWYIDNAKQLLVDVGATS